MATVKLGRWFTDDEFRCRCARPECDAPTLPDPALVALLDSLRDAVKEPLVVTSGLRCKWHNEALKGEPFSGHLTGTEADVACTTSRFRYRLVTKALELGIRRIGIYPRHVHVGTSQTSLPKDVLWVG